MAELRVRLQPRASRNEIVGERDGTLIVRVTAPPEDGKANEALRKLIAKQAGVPRSRITITQGHRSRDKTLRVEDIDATTLRQALGLQIELPMPGAFNFRRTNTHAP